MQKLLSLALVALLTLAGGCRDSLGPDADPAGTYTLVSINGTSPPAPFFSVEIVAGAVTLNTDGTYTVTSTIRGRDSLGELVTQTTSETGGYARSGDALRFTSSEGRVTVAAYDGRTLKVDQGGYALVYRRQ